MKGVNINDKIGIASLFESTEIKDYFNTLLMLVGGIEFFILIVHFLSSMGPDKGPFPWICPAHFPSRQTLQSKQVFLDRVIPICGYLALP